MRLVTLSEATSITNAKHTIAVQSYTLVRELITSAMGRLLPVCFDTSSAR